LTGTATPDEPHDPRWYAVSTLPRHEKTVLRHLTVKQVESFLPTYRSVRVWKNRQRVAVEMPLFPTYLFVRVAHRERGRVLQTPGVMSIVGNSRQALSLPDPEIESLRSLSGDQVEPFQDLVIGQKVRIKSGFMQGAQGTLVRKNNDYRFVLTIELINQHASIEIDPAVLEPIVQKLSA
jgi:transcription antitermination factor NusG